MNNNDNMVNMTIRIDRDFKKDMDNLFKNLGINTTSAIMMFLKQCDREKGLPFIASMSNTNERFLNVVKENINNDNTFEDISEDFEDVDDLY